MLRPLRERVVVASQPSQRVPASVAEPRAHGAPTCRAALELADG